MPDPRDPPSFYNDLSATLEQAWALLTRGVKDRHSGFHTPTIATLGLDGRPRARTVVLRGCDPAKGELRFHTDARAAKITELGRDARIALHGYDRDSKIQIRLEGIAHIHGDDAVADAAWAGSREFSRVCYGIAPGPGTAIEAAGDFTLPHDAVAIAAGRADFRAMIIKAQTLEWLYLAHEGHRRALFDLSSGSGRWLAP
ncbi:MAG: pyridoxamine 5'-phosphate oxidase family protein [Bosea sp. (in: a-proteobacteria)]